MSSEDFLLTVEELRLRRQKRRRIVVGTIATLLVLTAGYFCARPASHAIKNWQARRHAEKAFRYIDQEEWKEGRDEAVAALQLSRTEPAALRAVARLLSRTRQAEALDFWKQLAAITPLTRQDQRDKAMAALATENLPAADEAVKELLEPQGGGPAPADWLLAAQLAARRNAADQARSYLKQVISYPRATKRQVLQASLLQIAMAGNENAPASAKLSAEAWDRVEKFSKGSDAVALDALTLLAQRVLAERMSDGGGRKSDAKAARTTAVSSPSGKDADGTAPVPPITNNEEPTTASALADALEAHPLAKVPQKLLAIDLRIASAPEEKEELIEGAIKRWKGADNDALASLAKWLNGKGAFARELEAIPPQRALQSRDLFLQHVDALGALGRWDEIKRLLTSERFPLDATIAQMYQARCNAQLGEKTASQNSWQRALESAVGDVQKLMTLGDYAAKNGATGIAAQAYESATAANPKIRPAWQGQLQIAQAARETNSIHKVLAEMLEIWPNDSAIQNDEAYTRLLILSEPQPEGESLKSKGENGAVSSEPGTAPFSDLPSPTSDLRDGGPTAVSSESEKAPPSDLQALERTAQQLVQRAPASLPHRTLLALVYLKENRPATALGVYENLTIPPGALTPSALAVHAAVLAANGNAADAAKEAAQIPRSSLLPEEAELISGL